MNLLKLNFCKKNQDKELSEYFRKIIAPLNFRYVFNPSFYYKDDLKIFAFKAIIKNNDHSTSFVFIKDKFRQKIKNISLDLQEELGEVKLIDPKIFKLNKEFYITFNSGFVLEGNEIFAMKVYPEIGPVKKIYYKNRKKQERNWAFFSQGDQIYALYSINPLKILRVKNKEDKLWQLEDYYEAEKKDNNLSKKLTIGTQLFKYNNKYYFVSHKKIIPKRKKVYLGKLCVFDFASKKINPGKYWLAHSLKSMFGSKVKYNKNLFSATYFSGIQISNDYIKLGYGINDLNYGFSKHKFKEL